MKHGKLIVASFVAALGGAVGGIAFERYVGSAELVDWAGMRHLVMAYKPRDLSDRVAVAMPSMERGRTMVALVFGQSNAANSGETLGAEVPGVYELYRGRLYRARDPLLGADGDRGSVWMRLGKAAIDSGAFDTVILVPFAFGRTAIRRWAPGGSLHEPLLSLLAQARASGMEFTHLLWHQGEADATANTPPDQYEAALRALIASIRRHGVAAPIYIAVSTRCGRTRPDESIRLAQRAVVDAGAGILPGPDTDSLGFAERYDGCHFSTEGLDRAAELWLHAIRTS
ncbi:MAG: sialate O-acetylesterase, partial [Burkholderiales bacterium]